MEESRGLKVGGVSFATHRPSYENGKSENMGITKAIEHLNKGKPSPSYYRPIEIPRSPHQAMEFLSSPWSPSSSDFFQMLSSNNLVSPIKDSDGIEEHDERLEKGGTKRATTAQDDFTRTCHLQTMLQMHKPHKKSWHSSLSIFSKLVDKNKINMGYLKALIRGESTAGISPRQRERKEKLRLQTAQVHAALSVARLAAAVAGSAAMGGLGTHHYNNSVSNISNQGDAWNEKMNMVISSAAALVAAVCAEAAESAGACRAHVTLAVDSGLATRTCVDMLALTASAATSDDALGLRGASKLKSRAMSKYVSKGQEMLGRGAQLLVRTPNGKMQLLMVWIYHKHKKLMLKLSKKQWLGAFTSYKEYGIIKVLKDIDEASFTNDHQGLKLLKLTTCGGIMELMFQDEELCNIWMSTISHLLSNHDHLNH